MRRKKIVITERQEKLLIDEGIKIHKGQHGKSFSTQARWQDTVDCVHPDCDGKAYFMFSISDGNKGRGRLKVFDEDGTEKDSETQTIALYYCPKCFRITALNNMA